jgi:hypothetical protein
MKQLIVMAATVALGIVLFQLFAGDTDDSILSVLKNVWEQEIAIRSGHP